MGKVIMDEYLVIKTGRKVYIDHYVIGAEHGKTGGKRSMGTNRGKKWGYH